MAKETLYHVAYQVFTTIYFEANAVLSGPDLAQIWSATSIFGKQRVRGNFYHSDNIPSANKPRSIALGSQEILDGLLNATHAPFSALSAVGNQPGMWRTAISFSTTRMPAAIGDTTRCLT